MSFETILTPETIDEYTKAGFWQNKSENPEPTLQQIVNLFGYTTTIAKPGQVLNQGGAISRIGDEVLSAYWRKADSTQNVTVRQLAAYHTQGNPAFIRYFTVNDDRRGYADKPLHPRRP